MLLRYTGEGYCCWCVVEVYRWRLLLLKCKGEGGRCWCVLLKFTVECMGAEFYIGDGLNCSMYLVYVYVGISVTVYMLTFHRCLITLHSHIIVLFRDMLTLQECRFHL